MICTCYHQLKSMALVELHITYVLFLILTLQIGEVKHKSYLQVEVMNKVHMLNIFLLVIAFHYSQWILLGSLSNLTILLYLNHKFFQGKYRHGREDVLLQFSSYIWFGPVFLRGRFTLSKKFPVGQIRMAKKHGMSSMPLSDSQRDRSAFPGDFGGDACSLHSRVPKGFKRCTQPSLTARLKPETKNGPGKGCSS